MPAGDRTQFHLDAATRVLAGAGVVGQVGVWATSYGSRALLVAGDSHARASGLLARIETDLRAEGLEVELLEGVGPDPSVATVDAGALLARAWRADVVVAVGGGSVIDAAKAIATSAAMPSHGSFRTHLSGLRDNSLLVTGSLPVIAVPTLPGAGSETNGTSVITDDVTGRKLSAHSDVAAPRLALVDPVLALDAPVALLGPGLADGFCHALEAALSDAANVATDALAEQAMRTLLRTAPLAVDLELPREARLEALAAAWWASDLAGQALTGAGSIVTHPLAHPLSGRYDIRHGSAVAALEPAVLAIFADRFAASGAASRVGGWLDVRGAATDPDAAMRGIVTRLGRLCAALDVREGLAGFGLGPEQFPDVVRDARASGSRGLRAVPGGGEPTPEELFQVLDLAVAITPVATAKRVWDARAALSTARSV